MGSSSHTDLMQQLETLKALLFQAWLYIPYNTEQERALHLAISKAVDWEPYMPKQDREEEK